MKSTHLASHLHLLTYCASRQIALQSWNVEETEGMMVEKMFVGDCNAGTWKAEHVQ